VSEAACGCETGPVRAAWRLRVGTTRRSRVPWLVRVATLARTKPKTLICEKVKSENLKNVFCKNMFSEISRRRKKCSTKKIEKYEKGVPPPPLGGWGHTPKMTPFCSVEAPRTFPGKLGFSGVLRGISTTPKK
jgi:hypothetical protein